MMNKIGEINFKEIKRISPSQFYSMKNCAYKSLLAEAFNKKALLPLSPNSYFGTVVHKMLEMIIKGIIKDEDDFNTEFDKQVQTLEDELQLNGFGFYVPLKLKLNHIGLKKIKLMKHLRKESKAQKNYSNVNFYSEKWFESKDKLIGGKIDLVVENGNNIEIIDFKIGAITLDSFDDEGEVYSDIRNEYKEQLKLYAYLYFENTSKFPMRLSLVDLAKQKFSVEFSEQECKTLFDEAKTLLKSTNQSLKTNKFSANPNEINCKYCLYRPACSFYNMKLETDFSFNDTLGEIKAVKKFQNGNVSLILQNGNTVITIKNFVAKDFDELNNYRNKQVRIYNLKREAIEFTYSVTDTTMIYE